MKKSNYSKILSMILALVMVVSLTPLAAVNAFADSDTVVDNPNGYDYLVVDGSDSYPLFNSGATSSSGRQYSSSSGGDYNPNSHSQKNSGYDIYGDSPTGRDLTLGLGLSFYVQSEVTENATLTIYAYDIDEERSQIDDVYLVNDNTGVRYNVGYLSGRDETWSTSTFTIAADYFEVGETYHFEVDVCKGGWWTWVRSVSVQLTCGEYVPTVIEEHAFTASISQNGYVSTSLYLKTNQNITYNLEYTANIGQEQKGGYEGSSISANSNGVNAYDSFYLETGSPVGSYVITVVLKDANGNTVTSYSYTAGYEYSAVTYDSNGGSNNLPVDTNAYGSGETVYVSFDTIPSRAGYTFLGWASDRNATVPEFEANGITSFVIGGSDVVLYAVWQENPVEPPVQISTGKVLVIQNGEPWDWNSNHLLMSDLLSKGYIQGYDIVTYSDLSNYDFSDYSLIYVVSNDDNLTASQMNSMYDDIVDYLAEGGSVIYGLAWHNQYNITLPGNVSAKYYSNIYQGSISDPDHPIVTGVLTDNVPLTETYLKGNCLAHSYIYEDTLPADANVIFRSEDNYPILAEYDFGGGRVILSCLTWECFYYDGHTDQNRMFSKIAYDDLIVYAAGQYTPIDPPVEPPIDPDEPIEADVWDGTTANGFGGGSGTYYDPYLIYTAEELAYLAQSVNAGTTYSGKYFKLMNNLDLNYLQWKPIGVAADLQETSTAFCGHFDGANHIISNIKVTSFTGERGGLFGGVIDGSLKNLGVENIDYTLSHRARVGGLCGLLLRSSVDNCYATGKIQMSNFSSNIGAFGIGGLIGDMQSFTELKNCYADCDLTILATSAEVFGGVLVGFVCQRDSGYDYTEKYITNCYANGTLSKSGSVESVGGLVGQLYHGYLTVQNCFSTATVNNLSSKALVGSKDSGSLYIYNSYYPEGSSDFYGGYSTAISNFENQSWVESNLGWDFGSTWTYKTGYDYPVLQGFGNAGIVPNPHQHSFTEEYVEASCSSYGYTVYTCSCGYSYNDNYYILPHTPGDWIIDYEATCTTSGRKHTECIYCGQVFENIYIPAPGHTYISEVIRETTCEEYGIIQHTCVNCGDNYLTYVYSEHSYYVSERVEATCESDGYILYTCNNCSDSYTEVIPGGHDYVATITRVATADTDGEVLYTCSICGDSYTEIIPARPDANVLLIQDRWPWDENNNVTLLNKMLEDGYITGWDLTTTTNFGNVNLAGYNVILIANDQSSGTYNQLGALQDTLIQFANAGGVVIYGACDHGWAAGDISYTLPEGVSKTNYYSRYNYIVDADHPIVTGIYTDGKSINNNLLNGNYCSHTGFQNLPAGANVILQDAHGTPTLAEYAVGDGHIILSGLTWEFYYYRNCYDGRTNTSYTKNVYDDLIVYALYLSDPCEHAYDEGEIVDPTCVDNGYTLHTCELCGAYYKDNFVDPTGHVPGEWVVELEPTADEEGRKILSCTVCNEVLMSEVIPIINAPVVNIYAATNPVIIGQTFEVYVMVEGCDPVKSMAMTPVFDSDIFELVSKEWLVSATMKVTEPEIAAAWMNETNINTTLFKFVFRANQLTDGSLITADVLVQNDGVIRLSVVGSNVAVIECPHTNCTVSTIDADHHVAVCDVCGFATISAHAFDGVCDAICDDCGYERVAPHSYSESWTLDENGHWHVCDLCGAIDAVIDHVYADEYDMYCDDCGYQRFILGDVNADGYVDSDDAVHLLMHTYYPDDYTVNQPCDFDNDGDVDSDDAIRILMYVFFGDVEYPLTH